MFLFLRVYLFGSTPLLVEAFEQDESMSILDQHEIQLRKLETLVKNLTEVVARLESAIPDRKNVVMGSVKKEQRKIDVQMDVIVEEKILVDGEKSRIGLSVTKFNPAWSERFQFLSAVKLESEATCINVLPFEDYEGFSKYVAVGDEQGMVYVFLPNGDIVVEFNTLSESPITAMVSYMSIHKNESVLVTGHDNGVILVHRIWEASANGEDWHSLSMVNAKAFELEGEERLRITILEVHQVGRMRYILSSDASGKIRVLRENGTVYGYVIAKSPPLAFLKQRLLFLTESGAGSLDLRSMRITESECEGMNHSIVKNYAFDVSERSKAYGLTSEGDLIHVVLLGDIVNFKCRVRSKRKFEMDGILAIQTIKGYLVVVGVEKVFVYNVSSHHYVRVGAPRPVFLTSLDEIRSSFLNSNEISDNEECFKSTKLMMPLVASDREKLVILGLGSGYVGIYRSNLPVFNTEINTMIWTTPVLIFFLFLFGVWQFFGKKKESLTSWGSEEPFSSTSVATSVTTGATLGGGASPGDRQFSDSSSRAASDLRDLRGSGLRGPSRRYGSPSRYPGGNAIPFRPNSNDHNFRTATELKYRGPTLETTGFPKRRENLFSNSQVVEDNIDTMN
ncbi:hypothetical protein GIB67_028150 [Kingdonia uniflora]|uniref:Uncharacterized protein n=1 Tax=Kingdonia uniflora TaxID=39325 RepID=A0A7J7KZN1_9MAGN|nr:hypothetical protein GIB67_028150 [Kingdonia uniflora]